MIKPTFTVGIALIVLGVMGYFASEMASPTALIPSALGLLMFLSGLIGIAEKRRALGMHLAAIFALIGLIGAAMRLPKSVHSLSNPETSFPLAFACQAMMGLACALYLYLALHSFLQARRWKKSKPNS